MQRSNPRGKGRSWEDYRKEGGATGTGRAEKKGKRLAAAGPGGKATYNCFASKKREKTVVKRGVSGKRGGIWRRGWKRGAVDVTAVAGKKGGGCVFGEGEEKKDSIQVWR